MKPLEIQENKPLRETCTLGIGGPARYFIEIRTIEHAHEALDFARKKKLPFHVLGKGSNSLFDDRGYHGIIINNKIDFFKELEEGRFQVGAGYNFSLLGAQTARQGWAGLEFASGIPGSVGGAIFMNAGANGSETAHAVESVSFLHAAGAKQVLATKEMLFGYRSSLFHQLSGIIIDATFKLSQKPQARQKQLEIIEYRKKTQPYAEKSAGCIFRNPCGLSAGALIEKAGLKGHAIGAAKVSEKHANFIVNSGNASSAQFLALISIVQSEVKMHFGIELESEIRHIPFYRNDELTDV